MNKISKLIGRDLNAALTVQVIREYPDVAKEFCDREGLPWSGDAECLIHYLVASGRIHNIEVLASVRLNYKKHRNRTLYVGDN